MAKKKAKRKTKKKMSASHRAALLRNLKKARAARGTTKKKARAKRGSSVAAHYRASTKRGHHKIDDVAMHYAKSIKRGIKRHVVNPVEEAMKAAMGRGRRY